MSPWHRFLAAVLLAVGALAGCSGPSDLDQARTVFWSWHDAMQRGDRDAVRRLITFGSRDYIDSISFDRAQSGAQLRIAQERMEGNQAILRVNESHRGGNHTGSYVLVREDGAWRIDLVETAGLNSREVALPGPSMKWKFIPVPAVGSARH